MTKTLYFSISSDPSDAADDALLINADRFIAMGPAGTTQTTKMYFLDRANTGAAGTIITLTHDAGMFEKNICSPISSIPWITVQCTHSSFSFLGVNIKSS